MLLGLFRTWGSVSNSYLSVKFAFVMGTVHLILERVMFVTGEVGHQVFTAKSGDMQVVFSCFLL